MKQSCLIFPHIFNNFDNLLNKIKIQSVHNFSSQKTCKKISYWFAFSKIKIQKIKHKQTNKQTNKQKSHLKLLQISYSCSNSSPMNRTQLFSQYQHLNMRRFENSKSSPKSHAYCQVRDIPLFSVLSSQGIVTFCYY